MKLKNILFLFLFVFLGLITIKVYSQKKINTLNSKEHFEKLSGNPLSGKYGMVKALKVVYDIRSEKIYYINSKLYKYHYNFCFNELADNSSIYEFNQKNYSNNQNRRFLLGNINYFESTNKYVLEISPTDLMKSKDVIFLYNLISKTSFIKKNLYFLLNNPRLTEGNNFYEIKTLSPSEVYKNLKYQSISNYDNVGKLLFIKDLKKELYKIKSSDIIVLNKTPLFLPKVAGVIITQFQTPLSHLTILGRNRKIPIAVIKNAFKDSTLRALKNKKVIFKVSNNSYLIKKTKKNIKRIKKQKKVKLKFNLKIDSLIDIKYLNKRSYKFVGNKASNFSVLHKLSLKNSFKVPEHAFAIPFYFYNQHIENSNVNSHIKNLIKFTNNDSIKKHLKFIRNKIKAFPVDQKLINDITKKTANKNYKRFRFRSSTNAEDAKGFSGAGLYKSKTGIINDTIKSYEKAIKKVWASLWSEKAFFEREYYNINHKNVFMGILVHRSFPNEKINGVAITKNLYRPNYEGFVINAQIGNENVVDPTLDTTTDQFICYPNTRNNIYKDKITIDVITTSSLNKNKLTISRQEIQKLANQLNIIKSRFSRYSFKSYLNFGLDIEFKLDKEERDLYIKQVRFYND
ncbi:PEP/pyruvate-binding domain-containing protein [Polaribacter sp. Z022]|uniref:PEP/pyruvate-binding domain-containing protein n=1 Tax=Polaribacter sp. Z022 TaxID=2927125 RepID=UPI002021B8CC|nr:PEP/pyruvate-binding domain-containing protein [Polaribacter sp. Z022]MCL7754727.1 PEP/pyruvate-binding domain-containing protein [Polaribacter sp. Z022]